MDLTAVFILVISSPVPHPPARLDRWLWTVRLFKSRSLATDACRAGSVTIGGEPAKPAREVKPGDEVVVRQGLIRRVVIVRGCPPGRVGAKLVPTFCEDRTPPEARALAEQDRLGHFLARERGSGRPTKRDRRVLDQVFRPI